MQEENLKIKFLPSEVGKTPVLVRIKENDWVKNKGDVLRHCMNLLDATKDNNIILLHEKMTYLPDIETRTLLPDIESELKKITNKTIVTHNPYQNLQERKPSVPGVLEQNAHVLVACVEEFKGCEASNVIHVRYGEDNFRFKGYRNFYFWKYMNMKKK